MDSHTLKPGQQVAYFEMTDERKKRFSEIAKVCLDAITKGTESPMEAFMVLHFLKITIEASARCSFDKAIVVNDDDAEVRELFD